MNAAPVLHPMPDDGVLVSTVDGAYYVTRDDAAQIVVVGAMHFTPGDYFRALNECLDTHFEISHSDFLRTDFVSREMRVSILDRGFISLIGRRNGHAV